MIYRINDLNVEDNSVAYGFADDSLNFNPENLSDRKKLLGLIPFTEIGARIYEVRQVHGNDIAILNENSDNLSSLTAADGIFTQKSGAVLCIRTADCVPVLFTSLEDRTIGAVHCGWKGTYDNIIKNVKDTLINKFDSDLDKITVMIGPSVCKKCYEVKEDFLNLFTAKNPASMDFFTKNADKNEITFDLKGFIRNELYLNGFDDKNIYDINKCSLEDNNFYSYRRNKTNKRQVSFIVNL